MFTWHPLIPEIKAWLDQKTKEFAQEENQDPLLTPGQWLGRYVYSDIHFDEFHIILN